MAGNRGCQDISHQGISEQGRQAATACVYVTHVTEQETQASFRVGVRVRGMGGRGESDIASRWPSITDPMCHNVDGLQQCRSKGRSKVPKLKGLGITWAGKDNIPLILAGPR